MSKYTVRNLRADVDAINDCLKELGCDTRLECIGRYGYQAVDEYPVDSAGCRIGDGCVLRTVESGTASSCGTAAWRYLSNCKAKVPVVPSLLVKFRPYGWTEFCDREGWLYQAFHNEREAWNWAADCGDSVCDAFFVTSGEYLISSGSLEEEV